MLALNRELKQFLRQRLYRHYRVTRMSVKAARVISELFEAFKGDPGLLPPEAQQHAERAAAEKGEAGRARVIADYIAGMTDRYAIAEHQRLFDPMHTT